MRDLDGNRLVPADIKQVADRGSDKADGYYYNANGDMTGTGSRLR